MPEHDAIAMERDILNAHVVLDRIMGYDHDHTLAERIGFLEARLKTIDQNLERALQETRKMNTLIGGLR